VGLACTFLRGVGKSCSERWDLWGFVRKTSLEESDSKCFASLGRGVPNLLTQENLIINIFLTTTIFFFSPPSGLIFKRRPNGCAVRGWDYIKQGITKSPFFGWANLNMLVRICTPPPPPPPTPPPTHQEHNGFWCFDRNGLLYEL